VYSGHYDFSFPATEETLSERSTVKARFSFTYSRNEDGQWLITEHHSSALPEGNERCAYYVMLFQFGCRMNKVSIHSGVAT
jgi:hypothetical protein